MNRRPVTDAFTINKSEHETSEQHLARLLLIIELLESENAALKAKVTYLCAKFNESAK